MAAATVVRSRSRSGGSAVVAAFTSSGLESGRRVGFREGTARSPTDGADVRFRTTRLPSAWIRFPPTGSARSQYFPAYGCVDGRHVDVLGVGRRAAGHSDRLESRRRLGIRLLLQASRDPDPRGRALDQPGLPVDDEERDSIPTRPVVGRAGNDRNVLSRTTPERLQRSWRRCSRRSRLAVAGRRTAGGRTGATAADECDCATEREEGRSRADHRPILAAAPRRSARVSDRRTRCDRAA